MWSGAVGPRSVPLCPARHTSTQRGVISPTTDFTNRKPTTDHTTDRPASRPTDQCSETTAGLQTGEMSTKLKRTPLFGQDGHLGLPIVSPHPAQHKLQVGHGVVTAATKPLRFIQILIP